jgi:ribonuclease E
MLIDATHPEETRVVIVSGNRLEDFDIEVESRKQLKGNIYLAKVTRVEPSLQAAFVDYGGNRHGFLAFNEIHPDYYQIPVEDRQALLAEQEAAEKAEEAAHTAAGDGAEAKGEPTAVETVGGDDEEIDVRRPPPAHRRHYKIQEVIKRRQILLVQVVKEERGTKGAALTTYLSLAGRYCVLMPNTARGGGISRKIANATDRKRLKSILNDLAIPEGMAVIVRTAGAKRSKAEIKRDYEYLMRTWASVRETTLESIAPALVYEEGSLIKRSIRDLYANDIEEIIVAGDEGYRNAKEFMKLLIPSHAKKVRLYKDDAMSLLRRYQVESQLDAIHSPQVQLKSGGYIVLNPTEALVAIDVNSGRATRERNIEETALRTNLEAAEEIARQVRLRDLAGLIVIDFIDMEVNRNQAMVERRLKEAMRSDRARIQIGRISPFGLLELSRQRLRPSLIETSSVPCPHCGGTGVRRSTDSSALYVLRAIEEEGMRQRSEEITVHVATDVGLYILNQKRAALIELEGRFGMKVQIAADNSLIPPAHRIERVKTKAGAPAGEPKPAVEGERVEPAEAVETREVEPVSESATPAEAAVEPTHIEEGGRRRRRRRRRRRPGEEREAPTPTPMPTEVPLQAAGEEAIVEQPIESLESSATGDTDEERSHESRRRRRRGRRGGRNRRRREPIEGAGVVAEGDDSGMPMPSPADGALGGPAAPRVSDQFMSSDDRPSSVVLFPDDATPTAANIEAAPPSPPGPSPSSDTVVAAHEDSATMTSAPSEESAKTEAPRDTGKMSKTVVIEVGSQPASESAGPRRGWWRRPAE